MPRQRAFHHPDGEVEIVERAGRADADYAAFWRARIDVVEMLEVCRILDLSKQRQRVAPVVSLGPDGRNKRKSEPVRNCGDGGKNAGAQKNSTAQTQGNLRTVECTG